MRLPSPLLLLLAVTFLLGLAWAAATPPLQGPDEEAHLGYVQYLAETGNAPSGVGPGTPDSREVVVARTAYGLRRLIGNVSARPAWGASLHEEFTHADRANGSGGNPMAKNPPLYYAYEAVPYWAFHRASVVERQLWMRVASVLLGVLTVALTWLIAAELTAREWVRFTAAAAVALHPQLSFITATINPDALLVALTTAFVLAAVRVLRRGPSVAWMAALGATAGAAALTHGRGFALVPAAVVVVALALVRSRSRSPRYALAAAVPLAVLVLAAVAAAPDDELRQNTAAASFHARQFLEYVWQFYLPRLGFMHPPVSGPFGYRELYVEGFFGTFGSLEVRFSSRVYDLLFVATTAGLLALAAAVIARRRELLRAWPTVVALVSVVVCVIGLLHVAAYHDAPAQLLVGRYLLPLVSIAGLAIAFVCSSVGPTLAAVVLGAGVLLQLGALGIELARFYG